MGNQIKDAALIVPEEIDCAVIYCDSSWNCRGDFSTQSVADLADDIRNRGLNEPIDIQPVCDTPGLPPGFLFRVVCGHRRFTAWTTYLQRSRIPARIHRGLTEREARIKNLKENDERENLNPLQEALALRQIIREYPSKTPIVTIYTDLKKSFRWFQSRVQLLELPEEVQQLIAARRIAAHEIEVVRRGKTSEKQIEIAHRLVAAKRGRGLKRFNLDESLFRKFRRVRGKEEINSMIGRILELELDHRMSAARVLAWAAGYVSDSEIDGDISKILASEDHGES